MPPQIDLILWVDPSVQRDIPAAVPGIVKSGHHGIWQKEHKAWHVMHGQCLELLASRFHEPKLGILCMI